MFLRLMVLLADIQKRITVFHSLVLKQHQQITTNYSMMAKNINNLKMLIEK